MTSENWLTVWANTARNKMKEAIAALVLFLLLTFWSRIAPFNKKYCRNISLRSVAVISNRNLMFTAS